MIRSLLMLCLSLPAPAAFAQDRTLDVDDFSAIEVAGSFDVEVGIGDETRVTLDGEPGDVEDIEIGVEDGVLEAEQKWRFLGRNSDLDVTLRITTPSLNALEAGRGASVQLSGVKADAFSIESSTGAMVEASGRCDSLDAEVSTGGVLNARALECRNVSVEASTGAVAELYASERAAGEANTGGEAEIYGAPAAFEADTSLGGSITLADGEG